MPDFLASDTCTNLNGYFGCEGEFNDKGKPECYSTLFPELLLTGDTNVALEEPGFAVWSR